MRDIVLSCTFNVADMHCMRTAPATELYALVTRILQCSLTKAAPRSAATERASTTRINCGGWASLPAEASRLRHRVRDTWRLRTPPERSAEPRLTGARMVHVEVRNPSAGVRIHVFRR